MQKLPNTQSDLIWINPRQFKSSTILHLAQSYCAADAGTPAILHPAQISFLEFQINLHRVHGGSSELRVELVVVLRISYLVPTTMKYKSFIINQAILVVAQTQLQTF